MHPQILCRFRMPIEVLDNVVEAICVFHKIMALNSLVRKSV